MLRKMNDFAEKQFKSGGANNEGDPNLSDEDFFDMGQYTLDKEQLLNPNSKLHNLFGGLKQLEGPSALKGKQVNESSEEKLIHFDKDYDFSDSEAEAQD